MHRYISERCFTEQKKSVYIIWNGNLCLLLTFIFLIYFGTTALHAWMFLTQTEPIWQKVSGRKMHKLKDVSSVYFKVKVQLHNNYRLFCSQQHAIHCYMWLHYNREDINSWGLSLRRLQKWLNNIFYFHEPHVCFTCVSEEFARVGSDDSDFWVIETICTIVAAIRDKWWWVYICQLSFSCVNRKLGIRALKIFFFSFSIIIMLTWRAK